VSVDHPAVAAGGSRFFVAWSDWRNGRSEIYGSRVTRTGVALDHAGIPIATSLQGQTPSVAYDGANFLVVWIGAEPGGFDGRIYGARVTPDGTVLDPVGISISTVKGYRAALAFDGSNYLVVWGAWNGLRSDVYGARVSSAGTVLDSTPILISRDSGGPAVAFGGTNYLVAWAKNSGIGGTRVSPAGSILDPQGIVISAGGSSQQSPAIAFDGTKYLVVWDDWGPPGCCAISGARITSAGVVLDPTGIMVSAGPSGQSPRVPALAFDGKNYLVTWSESLGFDMDVFGARVTRAGRVLDPRARLLSTAAGCEVPNVVGRRLPSARRRIHGAHCSIGRIRAKRSRRVGRVLSQSPSAGALRALGYPVRLVIGRR
jgi:hypothetical protein